MASKPQLMLSTLQEAFTAASTKYSQTIFRLWSLLLDASIIKCTVATSLVTLCFVLVIPAFVLHGGRPDFGHSSFDKNRVTANVLSLHIPGRLEVFIPIRK